MVMLLSPTVHLSDCPLACPPAHLSVGSKFLLFCKWSGHVGAGKRVCAGDLGVSCRKDLQKNPLEKLQLCFLVDFYDILALRIIEI